MRLNQWLAKHTELSRRKADDVIASGQVSIDGKIAQLGDQVNDSQAVSINGRPVKASFKPVLIALNKPVGYVCSRDGQGSKTVYDLLPAEYKNLKLVGRLDKDSSGLVLLTNDGQLLQKMTHPSFSKQKIYEVVLDKSLSQTDQNKLEQGVEIGDSRPSKLKLSRISDLKFRVSLAEGRNRQIRRSFESLGYNIRQLHRTQVADYSLGNLRECSFTVIHDKILN